MKKYNLVKERENGDNVILKLIVRILAFLIWKLLQFYTCIQIYLINQTLPSIIQHTIIKIIKALTIRVDQVSLISLSYKTPSLFLSLFLDQALSFFIIIYLILQNNMTKIYVFLNLLCFTLIYSQCYSSQCQILFCKYCLCQAPDTCTQCNNDYSLKHNSDSQKNTTSNFCVLQPKDVIVSYYIVLLIIFSIFIGCCLILGYLKLKSYRARTKNTIQGISLALQSPQTLGDLNMNNKQNLIILDNLKQKCSICFDNNCNAITKCNHYFHFVCLKEWLKKKDRCPLCNSKNMNWIGVIQCIICDKKVKYVDKKSTIGQKVQCGKHDKQMRLTQQ